MAAITKPSSPGWRDVQAVYHKVLARSTSPFTMASQAFVWPGERWSFTFTLPPIKNTAIAKAWCAFLYDLARAGNYFVCDVSRYVPASAAQSMNLRLTSPNASWSVDTAKIYGFTFECEVDQ